MRAWLLGLFLVLTGLVGCAKPDTIPVPVPQVEQSCSDPLGLYRDRSYQPCCVAHDRAYYVGGVEADRLAADTHLYYCIWRRSGSKAEAEVMFYAVRIWGASRFRFKEYRP